MGQAAAGRLITLTQALRERKQLDAVGGAAYITSLIDFTPTAANASYYLDIVKEKHTLRRIIATCTDCSRRAYEDNGEVNILLDEVEREVLAINEDRVKEVPNMKEHVVQAIETIEQLYERRGAITGLPTGFTELDRMTSGLHGAEMFVIAARPSMGKTALAMNIAEHVAINTQASGGDLLAGNEQPAARPASAVLAGAGEFAKSARRLPERTRFPEPDQRREQAGGQRDLHRRHVGR